MANLNINRRTVLRGFGAVVALPWLEAMTTRSLSRSANSQPSASTEAPQRTAFFYVPNGMHMPDWKPLKKQDGIQLSKILRPLNKHRDKINIYGGLTLNGARALGDGPGDHARSVAAFLTGAHPKKTGGAGIYNGPSVDQVLAQQVGDRTRLPSLEVGMERSAKAGKCDSGYSCVYSSNISWRTPTAPVAKEINPAALFDRLFGSTDERESNQAAENRKLYRRSILDLVKQQAKSLHRQLGAADRQKLDEYLYAIRDVERRLQSSNKLEEKEIDVPDYPRPEGVPREYEDHIKLLFDVMVLAFQTDSTRVCTFMYANAGSNRSYRNIGIRHGHHDLSHHGNDKEKQKQISRINQFHARLFSYYLDKLASIREGDRSLLENCMIMYGSGIADGNRHAHHALPIITVGSGGGRYVTGQYFRFPKETPLTNLYLTMLQGAGADVVSFGDSNGTLDQILKG